MAPEVTGRLGGTPRNKVTAGRLGGTPGTGGRLVLCGTPIGNLDDMAPRAVEALRAADVIACEDTRRTRKLLSHFGIPTPAMVVLNDVTERRKTPEVVAEVRRGRTVALVSDAGMPGLSDPGYRLVRACIDAGLKVEVVPGPSAVVTALALSGLAPGRFVFEGFLPRKPGDRRKRIESLATEPRTIVLFESPHRIEATLEDLRAVLGDRRVSLARELTKLYEEVVRGSLSEVIAALQDKPPRGEITLVVEGAVHSHKAEPPGDELAERARTLMAEGVDRKEAMARVARETGVSRRKVFDALLDE
ncbi:MAG: 16S rRNA (cytidine(1402)-2'-O)-methyltransferase [Actinomycetota bacterium]|nr:16S rRNA (cytidine(1402)-2'-O)-methyltransferase [Actinomycetota bacterium]